MTMWPLCVVLIYPQVIQFGADCNQDECSCRDPGAEENKNRTASSDRGGGSGAAAGGAQWDRRFKKKNKKKKHRLFTATIRKRSPRNESEKWVIIRSYNVMKGVKKREKFCFFLYKLMKHKNILKWKFVFLVPKLMFFSQCCICSRTFSVWLKKLSIILM